MELTPKKIGKLHYLSRCLSNGQEREGGIGAYFEKRLDGSRLLIEGALRDVTRFSASSERPLMIQAVFVARHDMHEVALGILVHCV